MLEKRPYIKNFVKNKMPTDTSEVVNNSVFSQTEKE